MRGVLFVGVIGVIRCTKVPPCGKVGGLKCVFLLGCFWDVFARPCDLEFTGPKGAAKIFIGGNWNFILVLFAHCNVDML